MQAPAQPFVALARPDRQMISPPAAPVGYSVVRHLIYTSRLAWTQGWNRNVLAKAEFVLYASGEVLREIAER